MAVRGFGMRLARRTYLYLEGTPAASLLGSRPVRRLKSLVTRMPADEAARVLRAFRAGGVAATVAGGWGIDALAGRQTRRHYDLDLVIEREQEGPARAVLAGLGYRPGDEEHMPGLPLPRRRTLHDHAGHVVELLPAATGGPPFTAVPDPYAPGVIGGEPCTCLSVSLQRLLHRGYPPRACEPGDLRVLGSLDRVAPGGGPR